MIGADQKSRRNPHMLHFAALIEARNSLVFGGDHHQDGASVRKMPIIGSWVQMREDALRYRAQEMDAERRRRAQEEHAIHNPVMLMPGETLTQAAERQRRMYEGMRNAVPQPVPLVDVVRRLEARVERLEKALELKNTLPQRKIQCSCGCHDDE